MQVTMGSIIHIYSQVSLGPIVNRMVLYKLYALPFTSHWDSEQHPLTARCYFSDFQDNLNLQYLLLGRSPRSSAVLSRVPSVDLGIYVGDEQSRLQHLLLLCNACLSYGNLLI